jgi:kumamolisin
MSRLQRRAFPALSLLFLSCIWISSPLFAAALQKVHISTTPVVSRLNPTGRLPGSRHLRLAISLPLRNQQALTALLGQLQDRASPNYHKYLTPAQFAERFGPAEADYQAVIAFAQGHGLSAGYSGW